MSSKKPEMQNNYTGSVNIPMSGIVKDTSDSLLKGDVVTHARNATYSSPRERDRFRKTEQSNYEFVKLPYGSVIGDEKLPDSTICLFVTDDVNSEIGIFDPIRKTYKTILKETWLNFNRKNLITCCSKQNSDTTFSIYWSDGRRNPDRILNLSKIFTANQENTLLAKLITPPIITINKSKQGVLPNGTYQAAIQYSIADVEFDRVHSLTLPVSIYDINDDRGSLEISISNLDSDFTQYKLIIIQHHKETTTAKVVGTYSTNVKKVVVTNFDDSNNKPIPLERLVINNPVWVKSDQFSSNNEYLFRMGPETVPEPNYQLSCFDIKAKYVVKQVPEDYYEYGDDDGHYRGEVYSYSIQLLHKLGFYSNKFTIPGRTPKPFDLELATGDDVYETKIKSCEEPSIVRNFQVFETASGMALTNEPFRDTCDGRIYAKGEMAYYESTDLYPNNTIQFGEFANTPIRLHKFPSEERVPRYSIIDGRRYINILGIEFNDIPLPKKEDGTVDTDWVGYRIIREELRENRSVISCGLLTNQRIINDVRNGENVKVMYSNFYNDLGPDQLISEKQTTNRNAREQDFIAAKDYSKTKFNYYAPHSLIDRRDLATEMEIVSQEVGSVVGVFEKQEATPLQKLLSPYSYWLATILGSLEGFLVLSGKTTLTSSSKSVATPPSAVGKEYDITSEYRVNSVEDLISFDVVGAITSAALATDPAKVRTIVRLVLTSLAAIGVKALFFNLYAIQKANQIIQIIDDFVDYTDYMFQYNSKAFYNNSFISNKGFKRRFVNNYRYLENGLYDLGNNEYINNSGKEKSIYVELNNELEEFRVKDNSKQTMTQFKVKPGQTTNSTSSVYYVRNKRKLVNQYGTLDSQNSPMLTHNGYFTFDSKPTPIFRGGCYINKVALIKEHQFFSQDLSNANFPNGVGYDFRRYRNIGFPRFWANFFKFDFSSYQSLSLRNLFFSTFARNTTIMHNLDGYKTPKIGNFRVDDAYMYTSYNGVMEFYCESDYNLAFRERGNRKMYSELNSDLSTIFSSKLKDTKEEFKISRDYSKQAIEIYAEQQQSDYEPGLYNRTYVYDRNRIIYSLPQNREQQFDNWQYFLGNNTYLFPLSEFGNLVSLHRIVGDRLMFLFDKSSPYVTMGQDTLTMDQSGRKITIGDGGLFSQTIKEEIYTDTAYGNSQSRFGSINTPFGTYYISERQGRIFQFSSSIKEICRDTVGNWNKQYIPLQLKKLYPDYKHSDNTVIGIGYRMSYDSKYEIIYISKRDYYPKFKNIVYDANQDKFLLDGVEVLLTNPTFFEDISLTISVLPTGDGYISFHDWKPDWMLSSENSLFTIKNSSIWKHNDNTTSYCNYYNEQYPFEIAISAPSQFKTNVLSNIEYVLEGHKYILDGYNRGMVIDTNFDKMLVYNNEQMSGYLDIKPSPKNPIERIKYPIRTQTGFDIISEKTESKCRINQFRDIVKNVDASKHLLYWNRNGYMFQVNTEAIDLNKPLNERKLFRNYDTNFWFCKMNPEDVELTFKHILTKKINSPR